MKRIQNIQSLFVVVVLVVVAACGTSSPPVQPSPVTNAVPAETQATTEPTAVPDFESTLAGRRPRQVQGAALRVPGRTEAGVR